MPDKAALLVANLGLILKTIQKSNGFFNNVVDVDYGVTNYDPNSYATDQYPRIEIIFNNIGVPDYTTTSSQVEIPITVNAYLRKKKDIETSLESYTESLNWTHDIRRGLSDWLKQMPEEIDGDLVDSQIQQTIGFPMTLLTCTSEFGIIFNECY